MIAINFFYPSVPLFGILHATMSIHVFIALSMIATDATLRWLMPEENRIKIFIATLFMNAASTIGGLLYLILADIGFSWIVNLTPLKHLFESSTIIITTTPTLYIHPIYAFWFFLQTTLFKTAIESLIARLFFKTVPFKKLILYIALVNAIMTLFGLAFPLMYEYFYAPIKQDMVWQTKRADEIIY